MPIIKCKYCGEVFVSLLDIQNHICLGKKADWKHSHPRNSKTAQALRDARRILTNSSKIHERAIKLKKLENNTTKPRNRARKRFKGVE